MIDFRYHIVSLVAVFLALGVGILMGTTVIKEAIVERNETLLRELNSEVKSERQQKRDAQDELALLQRFSKEGTKFFVGTRLAGKQVVVLAPQSANKVTRAAIEDEVQVMRTAGAAVPAVLVFTTKWELDDETSRQQLALRTGGPSNDVELLRRFAIVELSAKLGNATPVGDEEAKFGPAIAEHAPTLLKGLVDDGFLKVEERDSTNLDPNTLGGELLSVVVGTDDTKVPLEQFLVPFTKQMGLGGRTLAVEPLVPGQPQVYMDSLRADSKALAKLSTVDNVQSEVGLVSSVVALQQELSGVYEQLGIGKGATSLLPTRV